MARSITAHRKKRGRPATGRDLSIAVRFPPDAVAAIEAWGEKQDVTRSEAIRRLVEAGLKSSKPSRKKPKARIVPLSPRRR